MNIFYIGFENIDYSGRSIELIKVLSSIGTVYGIVLGTKRRDVDSHLKVINPDISYLKFISKAKKEYKNNKKNIDCLFVDNRKAALVAWLLKKQIKNKRIIYDMRELRIPSEIKKISSKLGCIPERRIIALSDLVICANEDRAQFVMQNYKVKRVTSFENIRMVCDYNLDNLSLYQEKYYHIFGKNSFKFISTSGTSLSRGNDKLVEAVSLVTSRPVDVLLVGGEFGERGSNETIKAICGKKGLNNVHLIEMVKSDELRYLIDNSDCGVVNYHSKDTNNKYCASGKIYEFVFANKPVVTTSNPPLKRFVEKYGIGCSGENYSDLINDMLANYEKYEENVKRLAPSLSVEKNNMELANTIKETILDSRIKE